MVYFYGTILKVVVYLLAVFEIVARGLRLTEGYSVMLVAARGLVLLLNARGLVLLLRARRA